MIIRILCSDWSIPDGGADPPEESDVVTAGDRDDDEAETAEDRDNSNLDVDVDDEEGDNHLDNDGGNLISQENNSSGHFIAVSRIIIVSLLITVNIIMMKKIMSS